MDNATHTLCALALARSGGDRLSSWATPTLLLAANAPDLDVLGQVSGGRTWYLCHHRGLTHAILGLTVETVLLALLVALIAKSVGKEGVRLSGLLGAAGLGFTSHLALDGLNTYGVRPWLPFDSSWYYGDVAFILDPWLWLAFGAAACWGSPGGAVARRGWPFWTGVGTAILGLGALAGRGPLAVPILWSLAMSAVYLLHHKGVPVERRRPAAFLGLSAAGLYLLILAGAGRLAHSQAVDSLPAGVEPRSVSVSPLPGVPWSFRVLFSTPHALHPVQVDLLRGELDAGDPVPSRLDDPALAGVQHTLEYQAWRVFARQPFVARDGSRLILGDGRYELRPRPSWCNLAVPLPKR